MSWGERIAGAARRWRRALWALLAALTVLAGAAAARVGVDNAVEVWFVEGDPALGWYREFQRTFGNDEVAVVGLFADSSAAGGGPEAGILDAPGLERVRAVTREAGRVDGVERATSVASQAAVRGGPGVLEVGPVLSEEGPVGPAEVEELRRLLREDPALGRLVSRDGEVALVLARMEAMDDIDARRDGILVELRARVGAIDPEAAFAGIGVIYAALNEASTRGAAAFVAASYALVALLLWRLLGGLRALLLTLLVVGLGSAWVMGAYGAAGRDVNMVTMVLPTLVLVIGTSDCVHMLSAVAAEEGDPDARVRRGVGLVFWPCLFNTLTTVAGFLALTASSMPVVRDLGLFAGVGLGAAFVLALAVCASAGAWAAPPRPAAGRLQRAVEALGELAVRRPGAVLVAAGALGLVAATGTTRLVVDTYSIDFLRRSHPVRVDSDRLEAAYGPYTPLEFVVERASGVRDPETLGAIADWQDRVARELPCPDVAEGERLEDAAPCAGWSASAADVVRRLDQVLGGESGYGVPRDADALDQLLFLYESDPDADLGRWISADGTRARVTFGVPMQSARGFAETIEAIAARAELPADAALRPSGYLPLYVRIMDYVVRSQVSSFALAFVIVFGLIGLLFRSAPAAALAVPANLLPVLAVLGLMGWTGIRLDVATVTISAIVLGLVVDDTVQFLWRYRHERARRGSVEDAVRAAVRAVGRPMAVTSLVLGAGFLALALAEIRSVAYFGLLLAVALGTALLGDLLVVPALLVGLDRARR